MRFYPLFLLGALLAAGCETTVDIDVPEHTPLLVVNSLFESDTTIAVSLSRSAGIAAGGTARPVLGRVVLFEGDQFVEELAPVCCADGLYGSSYEPVPGRTYRLRVESEGLDPVEATTRLPEAVPFEIVSAQPDPITGNVAVTLRVTDPPDQANYYALSVFTTDDTGIYGPGPYAEVLESDDTVLRANAVEGAILEGDVGRIRFLRTFFADDLFGGETYTLTFDIVPGFAEGRSAAARTYVRLDTVSELAYQYRRVYDQDGTDNPFAEPVQYPSNIEGGLGLFAGITRNSRLLPSR